MINPDDEGAEDELLAMGRDLLSQRELRGHRPLHVRRQRVVSMGHAPLVASLGYHTLRLGSAALDLHERGLRLESLPLVRATYETSLTVAWLSQSREGSAAFGNEHHRKTRALINEAVKSASASLRESVEKVNAPPWTDLETDAESKVRRFRDLCRATTAGDDGYAIYRLMSDYAHPSVPITEHYLTKADNEAGVVLHPVPEQPTDMFWLYMTVASMIWALRAVDDMDSTHPHRSYLRSAAKRLGVTEMIKLTDQARREEAIADQARRRAAWKGPRKRPARRRNDGNAKAD